MHARVFNNPRPTEHPTIGITECTAVTEQCTTSITVAYADLFAIDLG